MAVPRAPISGGIAIVCGLLLVAAVVRAFLEGSGDAWFSVFVLFTAFISTVLTWRSMKKSNQEYLDRLERLDLQ